LLGAISTGTEYWREYSSTLPKTSAMRSSYFDTNPGVWSAAMRERLSGMFDGRNRIGWTAVNNVAVAELSLSATGCADLGAEDLDRFGITRELDTMVPYDIPRRWAQRFASEKMAGIHYGARSTRGPMNVWALFGQAGKATVKERGGRVDYIDACALAGLTIVGKPKNMAGAASATPPTP
jgi:hypothetical protein